MRPTETPRPGVVALRDAEVADWLELRARAALLFWDPEDASSQKLRARIEVVAAAAAVEVGVLDVRSDALVAQAVGVEGVPTLVVFRGGEIVERLIGAPPERVLREALDEPHPPR